MSEKSSSPKTLAPYIPFQTFTSLVEKLKGTAVPGVIDTSILPSMSGSMRSQLMSALKFLRLIDGSGTVQKRLKDLVAAFGTESWKETLSDTISEAYADILRDVDLDSATQKQLDQSFRALGNVDGQMLEKAVRFYLAAMREADVKVSPHFTGSRRNPMGASSSKSTKRTPRRAASGSEESDEAEDPIQGMAKFRLPIPGKGDGVVHLPDDIDKDDWEMLKGQLDAYVNRLIKQKQSL